MVLFSVFSASAAATQPSLEHPLTIRQDGTTRGHAAPVRRHCVSGPAPCATCACSSATRPVSPGPGDRGRSVPREADAADAGTVDTGGEQVTISLLQRARLTEAPPAQVQVRYRPCVVVATEREPPTCLPSPRTSKGSLANGGGSDGPEAAEGPTGQGQAANRGGERAPRSRREEAAGRAGHGQAADRGGERAPRSRREEAAGRAGQGQAEGGVSAAGTRRGRRGGRGVPPWRPRP